MRFSRSKLQCCTIPGAHPRAINRETQIEPSSPPRYRGAPFSNPIPLFPPRREHRLRRHPHRDHDNPHPSRRLFLDRDFFSVRVRPRRQLRPSHRRRQTVSGDNIVEQRFSTLPAGSACCKSRRACFPVFSKKVLWLCSPRPRWRRPKSDKEKCEHRLLETF